MIYEKDLNEAIAQCQGEPNPNANTCIKLAAYLTIKRELFGDAEPLERTENAQSYSYAAEPTETHSIDYDSGTEFSAAIQGRDPAEVWPWVDELMSTLQALYPRLYDNAMRMLK